jgi:hypothetical protein
VIERLVRAYDRSVRRLGALVVAGIALALPVAATAVCDEPPYGMEVGRLSFGSTLASLARALAAQTQPTLPDGGRKILPHHRVVAFYGAPQSRELGALGIGTPAHAARNLAFQARAYTAADRSRPVLPALELIADVASADPQPDGSHRYRQNPEVVCSYLRAARRIRGLLVLDLQPGRTDFLHEAKLLERYLAEPDVSLALDPEWHVRAGELPGQVIGSTTADDVNRVSAWLSEVTMQRNLPQKLLIVHQFTAGMVRNREALRERPGLALVLNEDGFGTSEMKLATYHMLARESDPWYHGFKLFFEEDADLMSPAEVVRLRPAPDVVVYE